MGTSNAEKYNEKGVSFGKDISMSADMQDGVSKEILISEMSDEVCRYVSQTMPIYSDKVYVVKSYQPNDYYKLTQPILGVVDVSPINFAKDLNTYLRNLNQHVPESSIFVGCCIVVDSDAKRKLFSKSGRKGRPLYKAEVLGRLVFYGFSIIEFKEIEGLLYFMVMKVGEVLSEAEEGSNSILFPMVRVGKHGKTLKVFKFRTMHPYSQYLQKYVVRLNGYNEVGKPANDFRLTSWGRVFRKYWLDELPQLINLFKGELVLVGVRPLSRARFAELPPKVRRLRVKFKPGCIPPYVSLMMPDSEGNIEAEWIYMNERIKKGFRTDIKYFFLAVKNIITGKITSA